jgi:hypothetical protein
VQPDAGQATDSQRAETPFVLEPSELALDRATGAVDRLPTVGGARDEGVQPVGFDPYAGGLAFPGRATSLRSTPLGIGPGERPPAVLT